MSYFARLPGSCALNWLEKWAGRAGGIRTHTSFRSEDFKSSMSTVSSPPQENDAIPNYV